MPYAILGFLDPAAEDKVLALWQAVADAGLADNPHTEGLRPHLTLAAYDELDVDKAEQALGPVVAQLSPCCLTLSHLGLFTGERHVVFVAPTVTSDLLLMHSSIHELCNKWGSNPYPHYVPGQWVPHATIGLDLTLETALRVAEMTASLTLPMEVRLVEVGAIEFRPVRPCFTLRFGSCPAPKPPAAEAHHQPMA